MSNKVFLDSLVYIWVLVKKVKTWENQYWEPVIEETEVAIKCFLDYPQNRTNDIQTYIKYDALVLAAPTEDVNNWDSFKNFTFNWESIDNQEYDVKTVKKLTWESWIHHLEIELTKKE